MGAGPARRLRRDFAQPRRAIGVEAARGSYGSWRAHVVAARSLAAAHGTGAVRVRTAGARTIAGAFLVRGIDTEPRGAVARVPTAVAEPGALASRRLDVRDEERAG